jgi:hypothetical protein
MTDANVTGRAGIDTQPAGGALLHLLCDLPSALDPVLVEWWERLHHPELLTLPGFLSARRCRLVAPAGPGRILTLYRLSDAAAADQPRGNDFTLMPTELDGRVTFVRRVLQRAAPAASDSEPVGDAILQLLAPARPDPADLHRVTANVCGWPGVLSATPWRTGHDHAVHDRSEVVQLGDTDLVLAEVASAISDRARLLARAKRELPGWDAGYYEQAFPRTGVLRPRER